MHATAPHLPQAHVPDGLSGVQANDVTAETLSRLAALRPPGARVLSVYLNLDPSRVPTPSARQAELDSLLAEVERRYLDEEADLSRDERIALRADVERVRRVFSNGGAPTQAAHAMGLFASGAGELLEVVRLPRPVESIVVVDDSPYVQPLLELVAGDVWAVLLTNRRAARILVGDRDHLQELVRIEDDVHRWHAQGGWSQSRYQRGIEKEVHDHLRRTGEVLTDLRREVPFDHLIVGSSQELWREVEAALHPSLRELIVGRVELDISHSTPEAVHREAAAVIAGWERDRERAALDRLDQAIGRAGRAAAGLDDVLGALAERRVETLLLVPELRAPGVGCPTCGWLALSGTSCPVDEGPLEPHEDVVESAIEAALAQGATVIALEHLAGDLAERGDVAALLRF